MKLCHMHYGADIKCNECTVVLRWHKGLNFICRAVSRDSINLFKLSFCVCIKFQRSLEQRVFILACTNFIFKNILSGQNFHSSPLCKLRIKSSLMEETMMTVWERMMMAKEREELSLLPTINVQKLRNIKRWLREKIYFWNFAIKWLNLLMIFGVKVFFEVMKALRGIDILSVRLITKVDVMSEGK